MNQYLEQDGSIRGLCAYVSRSCLDYSMGLDRHRRLPWERALLLALPAYSHFPVSSHFRRTHAPLVVTLPAYSHAARTHTSGVLTCRSLFSRYPSRPAWSRRGPLTRLAWARSSRGIRHAWCGLVAVLSHALRGLVVRLGVGGRSVGFTARER